MSMKFVILLSSYALISKASDSELSLIEIGEFVSEKTNQTKADGKQYEYLKSFNDKLKELHSQIGRSLNKEIDKQPISSNQVHKINDINEMKPENQQNDKGYMYPAIFLLAILFIITVICILLSILGHSLIFTFLSILLSMLWVGVFCGFISKYLE